jgi:hypothetical protein
MRGRAGWAWWWPSLVAVATVDEREVWAGGGVLGLLLETSSFASRSFLLCTTQIVECLSHLGTVCWRQSKTSKKTYYLMGTPLFHYSNSNNSVILVLGGYFRIYIAKSRLQQDHIKAILGASYQMRNNMTVANLFFFLRSFLFYKMAKV